MMTQHHNELAGVELVRPRVGFVFEHSLGHVTHARNLRATLAAQDAITAEIHEVPWDMAGLPARIPGFNSNWTIRSGVRAWRLIHAMHRRRPLDALFVHTQVPAVLSSGWFRSIPTVVSLDATPLQYDSLGASYDHAVGPAAVEQLKWRAARTCLRRASHIVAWSQWAKNGVIDGYGIAEEKITVMPPGVRPALWTAPSRDDRPPDQVRILFVGGDLARKGGGVLLAAFARVRAALAGRPAGDAIDARLDLVTSTDVTETDGVTVHHGLGPNSRELIALYHAADVFCLPTFGDCLPMVLSEAGAAGLPLVSTAVAGIPEIVEDGVTGLLVPTGDTRAVEMALTRLAEQPELRRRLGDAAKAHVAARYDADVNCAALVNLLVGVSGGAVRTTDLVSGHGHR
jgi:glycosyltransferase involved in cell wall biosynthesis